MIHYHPDLVQGSDEWLAARCGLLAASEMHLIITPTNLKYAANDKSRAHLAEMVAQRITRYVEPRYISDDMLRGHEDEIEARALYSQHYAPVQTAGFVTRDDWGFTIGYSPDGLVGTAGQIEIKSRRQKFQVQTICAMEVPTEYVIQIQTGLLVTDRLWCDFVSYSGGLPMCVIRVYADALIQTAIVEAASDFEKTAASMMSDYETRTAHGLWIPTERRVEEEIVI